MSCNEKGYYIRYGVGEDISQYENRLIFKKVSGTVTLEYDSTSGLKLGVEDYYIDENLIYLANTYVILNTGSSGCFENGYWLVKLISTKENAIKESTEVKMEIYN